MGVRPGLVLLVGLGAFVGGLVELLRPIDGCGSTVFHHVTNGIGADFCTGDWTAHGQVGWPLVVVGALLLAGLAVRAVYRRGGI